MSIPIESPTFESPTRGHYWQLDVLRAAAILGVFAFHFVGERDAYRFVLSHPQGFDFADRSYSFWISSPALLGAAGVTLFFVLSGFCIHNSQLRSSERRGDQGIRIWDFYVRRFWRIYPAYLVALLAFVSLYGADRFSLVSHVLMIHNISGRSLYSINGSFWSLAVEWQFYLIYPAFWLACCRFGTGRVVFLAVLTSLVYRATVFACGVPFSAGTWWMSPTGTYGEWCIGAYIADRLHHRRPAVDRVLAAYAISGIVAIAGTVWFPAIIASRLAWAFLFGLMIDSYLRIHRKPALMERIAIPVGLASYSFYLYHQPIVIYWVKSRSHQSEGWAILGASAALVVTLLVSCISYFGVEKIGVSCGHHIKRICLRGQRSDFEQKESRLFLLAVAFAGSLLIVIGLTVRIIRRHSAPAANLPSPTYTHSSPDAVDAGFFAEQLDRFRRLPQRLGSVVFDGDGISARLLADVLDRGDAGDRSPAWQELLRRGVRSRAILGATSKGSGQSSGRLQSSGQMPS